MPEYFDISFIARTIEPKQKEKIQNLFLRNIYLQEGKNYLVASNYDFLRQKTVLLNTYQDDDADYVECTISIPDVVFYKRSYESGFSAIGKLVKDCFKLYQFDYAFCSYEINSYLITNVRAIDDMQQPFLSKFPLYFTRGPEEPIMHVNLNAQDIFIDEH